MPNPGPLEDRVISLSCFPCRHFMKFVNQSWQFIPGFFIARPCSPAGWPPTSAPARPVGGRLRIIVALTDPDSIQTDLQGVGRPAMPPPRAPPHTPVRVRRLTSSAMGAGEPYGERRPQWSQRGPGCSRLYGIDGSPDMAAKAWSKVFTSWTLRRRQLAR